MCGEGGNDVLRGEAGDDELIGDELDSAPFVPSNGNNNDSLDGGPATTPWPDSAATTTSMAGMATTS